MLMPKRVKHRKVQRGRMKGKAQSGNSLHFGEFGRALVQSQRAHAGADGAGGDDHNFPARPALPGDLRHELFQLGRIGLFAAVREHARAEFHNEAGGGLERITMHTPRLGKISLAENAKMAAILLGQQLKNT